MKFHLLAGETISLGFKFLACSGLILDAEIYEILFSLSHFIFFDVASSDSGVWKLVNNVHFHFLSGKIGLK